MEVKLKPLQSINEVGYVLSVSNSKISFDADRNISSMVDFNYYYLIGKVDSEHYRNIIVKTEKNITKIAECVNLQKTNIPRGKIVVEFESFPQYIKKSEITDLLILNKDLLLVKGNLYFSYVDNDPGDEYPYFGILLQGESKLLVKDFCELLNVLLIGEKYYFVTYWQEPECGKRGLIVYTLEGGSLKEVCADYSEAT